MNSNVLTKNSTYFRSNQQISPALNELLKNKALANTQNAVSEPNITPSPNINENQDSVSLQNTNTNEIEENNTKKEKTKEKKLSLYERGKRYIVKCLQNFNTTIAVAKGGITGVTSTIATLGTVSLIGKSITDAIDKNKAKTVEETAENAAKNKAVLKTGKIILDTTSNIINDIGSATKGVANFIRNIPEKSVKENIKELMSPIPRLYSRYLNVFKKAGEGVRTYRLVATIATLAGGAVFCTKFLKEKFAANEKNANLEHKTNLGHVKS